MDVHSLLKEYRRRDAIHILEAARSHARRLETPFISTRHLALALLDHTGAYPNRVLRVLAIDIGELRDELETSQAVSRNTRARGAELPFSNRAVSALRTSLQWAKAKGRTGFESLGLLLALVQDRQTELALALERRKVGLSDLSFVVESILPENASPMPILAGSDVSSRITISDTDERPYHRQISDWIRVAVANERLAAGDRVPSIRSLADELSIAPGTVARAYEELEAEGVLVADGARGSFIAWPRVLDLKSSLALTERHFRTVVTTGLRMGLKPIQLRDCFEGILRSA